MYKECNISYVAGFSAVTTVYDMYIATDETQTLRTTQIPIKTHRNMAKIAAVTNILTSSSLSVNI